MKITRSQKQWKAILEEQKTTDLTIIDYCREDQLSTSSFYVFRATTIHF
jgi:putative transposase